MVSVCFYFQVHQPMRLRNYSVFEIGHHNNYFNEQKNEAIIKKVAKKCYIPANKIVLDLINKTDGRFKAAYSMTGIVLEQFERHAPEVVDSFRQLVDTGCVEMLDETYHHTLSFLYSKDDFREQVQMHNKKIRKMFNFKPKVFRNTELIYSNEIAGFVEKMGYKGIIAEGADHILQWRSPNFLYKPSGLNGIKLLLKNYRLSDDIAFRFSEKSWKEFPLTAEKYADWVSQVNGNGNVVNLFMDYETFGEHQWEDKGIFEFLKHMPHEIFKHPDNDFVTPSEAIRRYNAVAELDFPSFVSWADVERDMSAWLGNKMQQEALRDIYLLETAVKLSRNPALIDEWRKLQTSDHFYYMCTKWFNDGDVHKYFNPYDSPYEAFISYMNILNDFRIKANRLSEIKVGE
ncbi:polysaccharide deacetylase family protein [Candidatus Woesearchaeota archaeon]|nr:polysaccharide deacetylase family protein [Candidatus Woesearchaeota archaeon]